MKTRAGWELRWGRASVLAAVAAATGVAAHLGAGGLMPGAAGLIVIFAVCLAWSAALLGRPATTRRVVLMVMAVQTFTHGALTAMSGHRGDPVIASSTSHPKPLPVPPATVMDGSQRAPWGDQMHAANPAAGAPVQLSVPAPVQHLIADFTGPHALMAIAHLVAAAAVGLWLARGEQLVWSLVSLSAQSAVAFASSIVAVLRGPAVTRHLGPVTATRGAAPEDAGLSRPVRWFTPAAARRGPPVLAGV